MDQKIPSLNLIKQVNPEAPARQPYVYKPFIFDALTVGAAYAAGWAYGQYLGGNIQAAALLGVFGFFAALSALQVFFTKGLGRRFLILVLETAAILFSFYRYDLKFLGAAAGVMLLFRFWGEIRGHTELENGLEIKFFKVAKPALQKLTTALFATLVILYLPQLNQENVFLSKSNFQVFFDWAAGAAKNFYPEINFNSSFSKLAEDLARFELQGNSNFKSLPPPSQESLIQQTAIQVREGLEKNIGKKLLPNEPVSEVLYEFIVEMLARSKNQFPSWFLAIWAIAIFTTIRGFGFIFYWLVGITAFVLYQILLSFGFIHIIGESRTHEVIGF